MTTETTVTAPNVALVAKTEPWTHDLLAIGSIRGNKDLQAASRIVTNSDSPEAWALHMAKVLGVENFKLGEDSAAVWRRIDIKRFPNAEVAGQYLWNALVNKETHDAVAVDAPEPDDRTKDEYDAFMAAIDSALKLRTANRKLQREVWLQTGYDTRDAAWNERAELSTILSLIEMATLPQAPVSEPPPPVTPPVKTAQRPRDERPRKPGNPFQPAASVDSYLRLALTGISGSGKTATALALATALKPNARIAVIDTENGSAEKYRKVFSFDVCHVNNHDPRTYLELLAAAEDNGYDVVIIDSFSHEWMAEGGVLDIHGSLTDGKYKGNSFAAWKDIKPTHNRLIQALQTVKAHVIVTMRVKSEWRIEENERGKQVPIRVGLAAIQGEGVEYEFDVVGNIGADHVVSIEKTRCPELDRTTWIEPAKMGAVLANWLVDIGTVETVA